MKTDNLTFKEKDEYIFRDVKAKIIEKMELMKKTAILASLEINWDDFRDYIYEIGMSEPPNIFTVPKSVIDECINEIRK